MFTIPLVYALGRTIRDHSLGIVAAPAVRDLPVPGLVLAGGARVLARDPRSDVAMLGVAFLLRHPERSGSLRASWLGLLAYVSERQPRFLAHDTAVFLPIGANVLMLGRWSTHGRGRGLPADWLLAQVAVLCLWASSLPAYLHQVARRGRVLLGSRVRPWAAC